eukprot:CAMPEP_0202685728 /NCGR_PEP_ID=MMETSP1385-20130828/1561_1 /ASSEMBLY_ACC=CAM_ASM_000861 /TAXON_ID=933848 /ORGANISM="Elphidium margaritaceum" /LENGTH=145 /DNA_ID=CAMNT_0049340155 /DNA_START=45 /DNA_END=482 /DNA_ORIENTATION=+
MSFKGNNFSGSQCQFIGKAKHCTIAPTARLHPPSPPPPKLPLPFSTLQIIWGVEKATREFKLENLARHTDDEEEDVDIKVAEVAEVEEEGKVETAVEDDGDADAEDGHGKECRKSRKRKFAQLQMDDPIAQNDDCDQKKKYLKKM